MKKLVVAITTLTFALGLTACAELKTVGRDIGHATKDVTTSIGHASRDIAKDISN
jgi:predicted small secreted protein